MRRTVYFAHTTLDGRISTADGGFWEPFPWGEQEEMAYNNEFFRTADTWVLGRRMYEGIVPWWESVAAGNTPDDVPEMTAEDREFARLQHDMHKVVVSDTLQATPGDRTDLSRDPVGDLWALKQAEGSAILLSCGPALFAVFMAEPGLVDELLIVMHPVALHDGPQLYAGLQRTVPVKLLSATPLTRGAAILRYARGRS